MVSSDVLSSNDLPSFYIRFVRVIKCRYLISKSYSQALRRVADQFPSAAKPRTARIVSVPSYLETVCASLGDLPPWSHLFRPQRLGHRTISQIHFERHDLQNDQWCKPRYCWRWGKRVLLTNQSRMNVFACFSLSLSIYIYESVRIRSELPVCLSYTILPCPIFFLPSSYLLLPFSPFPS